MTDNDLMVLEDARDAAFTLDKAYRRAVRGSDTAAMRKLRPEVNKAYSAVGRARRKLLEAGVLATGADVTRMRRLKAEIDHAADTRQLINGAAKIVKFLLKFS